MPKYRKKPVVIEAVQLAECDHDQWCEVMSWVFDGGDVVGPLGEGDEPYIFYVMTLEGEMKAQPGDWIIRGVQGEHYPCKPDVFELTYEPVE